MNKKVLKLLGYEDDINTLYEIANIISETSWQRVDKNKMFQRLLDIIPVHQINTPSQRVLCVYLNSKSPDGKPILGARFIFNRNYQCKINPILYCNRVFNLASNLKKEALELEKKDE